MPIPPPKKGETKEDYIPRCASIMADRDPDKPNKQRIAMCYSKWEQTKKEEAMEKHKKTLDLAENRKFNEFKKSIHELLASKAKTLMEKKKADVAESMLLNAASPQHSLSESKTINSANDAIENLTKSLKSIKPKSKTEAQLQDPGEEFEIINWLKSHNFTKEGPAKAVEHKQTWSNGSVKVHFNKKKGTIKAE